MPNMDVSLDELIASNAKQASKKPGRGGGGRGRGGGRGGRGITKPGKRAAVVKKKAGGGGGGGRQRQGAEVKIGAVTDIKLAAGAVANMMREGTPPKVLAISPTCVNAAVKTLALARRYLEEEGLELMATVDFPEFDESANSVSLSLSKALLILVFPQTLTGSVVSSPGERRAAPLSEAEADGPVDGRGAAASLLLLRAVQGSGRRGRHGPRVRRPARQAAVRLVRRAGGDARLAPGGLPRPPLPRGGRARPLRRARVRECRARAVDRPSLHARAQAERGALRAAPRSR